MFAELLIKARDIFSTESTLQESGYQTVNVSKIKTDLRLLHPQYYQAAYNPRCQHQLEAFLSTISAKILRLVEAAIHQSITIERCSKI